jgi:hypothetical protein
MNDGAEPEGALHVPPNLVRDRAEHLPGDLLQRVEQEVHPPIGLVTPVRPDDGTSSS